MGKNVDVIKSKIQELNNSKEHIERQILEWKLALLKVYIPGTKGTVELNNSTVFVTVVGSCVEPPELLLWGNTGGKSFIDPMEFTMKEEIVNGISTE